MNSVSQEMAIMIKKECVEMMMTFEDKMEMIDNMSHEVIRLSAKV